MVAEVSGIDIFLEDKLVASVHVEDAIPVHDVVKVVSIVGFHDRELCAEAEFPSEPIGLAIKLGSVDIDIPTDSGRAYSFQINMVMNDTGGTPANRGSFVVSQMLAYNNGGTATLVGTPAFTAITDGTDIANFTTSITTSGTNVRFTFTRNAATLGYRIAYWISFIEKD